MIRRSRKKSEIRIKIWEFYTGEGHRSLVKYDLHCNTFGVGLETSVLLLSQKRIEITLFSTPDNVQIE